MTPPFVAVIDYGIGNLRSAEKALQKSGAEARLVSDPNELTGAAGLVLPGVGAFGSCARALADSGHLESVRRALDTKIPFLGICVGLQLLYEGSDESPDDSGLGVVPGRIRRLPEGVKHPQMQWNILVPTAETEPAMLRGIPTPAWAYFVHSYAPEITASTSLTCDYGGPIAAAIEQPRLWGTQFHPEKSGAVGLALLSNFVDLCRQVGAVFSP